MPKKNKKNKSKFKSQKIKHGDCTYFSNDPQSSHEIPSYNDFSLDFNGYDIEQDFFMSSDTNLNDDDDEDDDNNDYVDDEIVMTGFSRKKLPEVYSIGCQTDSLMPQVVAEPPLIYENNDTFVNLGQNLTQSQVNDVAKNCLRSLAQANNQYVSLGLAMDLLLRRVSCVALRKMGIHQPEDIICFKEHLFLLNRINAALLAFIKVRPVCTLLELEKTLIAACWRGRIQHTTLRFDALKVGPLTCFPLAIQEFGLAPEIVGADVPDLDTNMILQHLMLYIVRTPRSQRNAQHFAESLAAERRLPSPNHLGMRLLSFPLVVQMLSVAESHNNRVVSGLYEMHKSLCRAELDQAFKELNQNLFKKKSQTDGFAPDDELMRKDAGLATLMLAEKLDRFFTRLDILRVTQVNMNSLALRTAACNFVQACRVDSDWSRALLGLVVCSSAGQLQQDLRRTKHKIYCCRCNGKDRQESPLAQQATSCAHGGANGSKTPMDTETECSSLSETELIKLCVDSVSQELASFRAKSQSSLLRVAAAAETLLCAKLHVQPAALQRTIERLTGSSSFLKLLCDRLELCDLFESATPTPGPASSLFHDELVQVLVNMNDSQADRVDDAVAAHFDLNVNDVRSMCLDRNTTSLLTAVAKGTAQSCADLKLEAVLCDLPSHNVSLQNTRSLSDMESEAISCLRRVPWLADARGHTSWDARFSSHLGSLNAWIRQRAASQAPDLRFMETAPRGRFLRIPAARNVQQDAVAIWRQICVESKDAKKAAIELVVSCADTGSVTALPRQFLCDVTLDAWSSLNHQQLVNFVLAVLVELPLRLAEQLGRELLLIPLEKVMRNVSCARSSLLDACQLHHEYQRLDHLGCSWNISEWCGTQEANVDNVLIQNPNSQSQTQADTKCNAIIVAPRPVARSIEVMSNVNVHPELSKSVCRALVEQIRVREFGVGVELSDDVAKLMAGQQLRLGRTLQRLSADLYATDSHFLLELIQNADDNAYPTVADCCPTLRICLRKDQLVLLNNECGFTERDLRALCDVGRSTKSRLHRARCIGQKGIGFKAVFRVSDRPQVHSNGFHVAFDRLSGPLGYVVPHWLDDCEEDDKGEWRTRLVLPFNYEAQLNRVRIAEELKPQLLLFMNRLRRLTLELDDRIVVDVRRVDLPDEQVELTMGDGSVERWLVLRRQLALPSGWSGRAGVRSGTNEAYALDEAELLVEPNAAMLCDTEIALALPLTTLQLTQNQPHTSTSDEDSKEDLDLFLTPQPVCAYLPLRYYGFRFLLHADWELPASREDVRQDSAWNEWLRERVCELLPIAVQHLVQSSETLGLEAWRLAARLMRVLPLPSEVSGFFQSAASAMLRQLRQLAWLPSAEHQQHDDRRLWRPDELMLPPEDGGYAAMLPRELLADLRLAHPQLTQVLRSAPRGRALIRELNLREFGVTELISMAVARWPLLCGGLRPFHTLSTFLLALDAALSVTAGTASSSLAASLLKSLATLDIFPVRRDGAASQFSNLLGTKPVFFSLVSGTSDEDDYELLSAAESSMLIFDNALLHSRNSLDEQTRLAQFLERRLGVQRVTPTQFLEHFVLPECATTNGALSKSHILLASHLAHRFLSPDRWAWLKGQLPFVVVENKNFSISSSSHFTHDQVYFPLEMGNAIDLTSSFPQLQLNLLDANAYHFSRTHNKEECRHFFAALGVTDHLSVDHVDKLLLLSQSLSPVCSGVLLNMLNRHWLSYYQQQACNTKEVEADQLSLFGRMLRETAWLHGKHPRQCFVGSAENKRLLGEHVVYVPDGLCMQLLHFLEVRSSVDCTLLFSLLADWSAKTLTAKEQRFSLEQLRGIYSLLMSQTSLLEVFLTKEYLFLPDKVSTSLASPRVSVTGRFVSLKKHDLVTTTATQSLLLIWELPPPELVAISPEFWRSHCCSVEQLYPALRNVVAAYLLENNGWRSLLLPFLCHLIQQKEDGVPLVVLNMLLSNKQDEVASFHLLRHQRSLMTRAGVVALPAQLLFMDNASLESALRRGSMNDSLNRALLSHELQASAAEHSEIRDLLLELGVTRLSCAARRELQRGEVQRDTDTGVLSKLASLVGFAQRWLLARGGEIWCSTTRHEQVARRLASLTWQVVTSLEVHWSVQPHWPLLHGTQLLNHVYEAREHLLLMSSVAVHSVQEACDAFATVLLRTDDVAEDCDTLCPLHKDLRSFLVEIYLVAAAGDELSFANTLRFHALDVLPAHLQSSNFAAWTVPLDGTQSTAPLEMMSSDVNDYERDNASDEEEASPATLLMRKIEIARAHRSDEHKSVGSAWPPNNAACSSRTFAPKRSIVADQEVEHSQAKRIRQDCASTTMENTPPLQQLLSLEQANSLLNQSNRCIPPQLSSDVRSREFRGDAFVGRQGERFVADYLASMIGQQLGSTGELVHWKWLNEVSESFAPYDFELRFANGQQMFVEVKSSITAEDPQNRRVSFPLSLPEVQFLIAHPKDFELFRVSGLGQPGHARIARVSDVAGRLRSHQLTLWLQI